MTDQLACVSFDIVLPRAKILSGVHGVEAYVICFHPPPPITGTRRFQKKKLWVQGLMSYFGLGPR